MLRAATIGVAALVARRAVFRAIFNVAQLTLSLGAAGLVLSAAGIHPQPLAPWLPQGEQLLAVALAAIAYFAVNAVLVDAAVALHSRAPVAATLRAALPSQAFVNLVLLSAAPRRGGHGPVGAARSAVPAADVGHPRQCRDVGAA